MIKKFLRFVVAVTLTILFLPVSIACATFSILREICVDIKELVKLEVEVFMDCMKEGVDLRPDDTEWN